MTATDIIKRADSIIAEAGDLLSKLKKQDQEVIDPEVPLAGEGGIHKHALLRDKNRTADDGIHQHVFLLKTDIGEMMYFTQLDGQHEHVLGEDKATKETSEHVHLVELMEGIVLPTKADGKHDHELQVMATAVDGTHVHVLEIPQELVHDLRVDQTRFTSMTAQQFVELFSIGKRVPVDAIVKGAKVFSLPPIIWRTDAPPGKLPTLKVDDPNFLLQRLTIGKDAGVVEPVRRRACVGEPHALVNHVEKGSGAGMYCYGVVGVGHPAAIDKTEALECIEKSDVQRVSEQDQSFYLPTELLMVFDPPLKLTKQVKGRRFGGEIDLTVDVEKQLGFDIHVDGERTDNRQFDGTDDTAPNITALHDGTGATMLFVGKFGDEEIGFVMNPTPEQVRALSDTDLRRVDRQLHKMFDELFGETHAERVKGISRDDVIRTHLAILFELSNRGIGTTEDDFLGHATAMALPSAPVAMSAHGFADDALEKGKQTREIQTLIFDKDKFSKAEAIAWAKDNDFKSDKVDENDSSYRLRQRDPDQFDSETFRTITLTDGVQAVVGELKASGKKKADDGEPTAKAIRPVKLLKADADDERVREERYVFGVVLVPNDVDAQGDTYDEEAVRNAAHSFMEHFSGTMKIMHQGKPVDGIKVLESYVSKTSETHGGHTFPVGTWFLATRAAPDEIWQAVQSKELDGYSIGGTALRQPLAST